MANGYVSSITLPNNDVLTIKDKNAINKVGVEGDLVYWSDTNTPTRLTIGTSGQVLKSNGTTPAWTDEYKVEIVDMMGAT